MMFIAGAVAVLVTMTMALFRSLKGPSVYDRILAINSFGTLTVVLISIHGFMTGRPEFLDLALVYALINFIGTIAVTKFVTYAHMGHPTDDNEPGDI
ncbi:MAG: monovalent cation/H+ antiporter complex subunit F [Rhodospirillales bacterium]|jgi:multicomponent Na+:H+ antiporter subunit F|tara:strand:+ start:661 stop:951 length:291 start_codon:yes stop_codon:yes gene_type:complete